MTKYELVEYNVKPKSEKMDNSIHRFIVSCNYKTEDGWEKEKYIVTVITLSDNQFVINNVFNTLNSKTTLYDYIKKIVNIYIDNSIGECKFNEKYYREYSINGINHIEMHDNSILDKTVTGTFSELKVEIKNSCDYIISDKIIEELDIKISRYSGKVLFCRDNTDDINNLIILDMSYTKSCIMDHHAAYAIVNEYLKSNRNPKLTVDLSKKIFN